MSNLFDKLFDSLLCRNWYILFFLFVTYAGYSYLIDKKNHEIVDVMQRMEMLKQENDQIYAIKKDLLLERNSQSDPMWIEQVLMKEVGLVPEGQLKIHFTKDQKK